MTLLLERIWKIQIKYVQTTDANSVQNRTHFICGFTENGKMRNITQKKLQRNFSQRDEYANSWTCANDDDVDFIWTSNLQSFNANAQSHTYIISVKHSIKSLFMFYSERLEKNRRNMILYMTKQRKRT